MTYELTKWQNAAREAIRERDEARADLEKWDDLRVEIHEQMRAGLTELIQSKWDAEACDPDAAMAADTVLDYLENDFAGQLARMQQRAGKAKAAIERVRTIHHFAECSNARCDLGGWCIGCDPDASSSCSEHPWPCPTVLTVSPAAKLPDVYADWVLRRDHDKVVARLAEVLAWQRAYIEAHPEAGTLDLIEATAKEMT